MNTSTIAPITILPKKLPFDDAIAIALQNKVTISRASYNIAITSRDQ
jgi:hypothetical protein